MPHTALVKCVAIKENLDLFPQNPSWFSGRDRILPEFVQSCIQCSNGSWQPWGQIPRFEQRRAARVLWYWFRVAEVNYGGRESLFLLSVV